MRILKPILTLALLVATSAHTQPTPDSPSHHHRPRPSFPRDPGDDSINLSIGKAGPNPGPLLPIQADPFGDRLDLTKDWQFRTGSGPTDQAVPAYATPTFPDREWTRIDTSRPLLLSGILNVNEVWYRRHILLAPGSHSLALTIADFGGSYRVYANGQEIGGHGRMSGRGDYLVAPSSTFPIPDSVLDQPELVIAIHAFVGTVDRAEFTLADGIGKTSTVSLGTANVLYRDQQSYYDHALSESPAVLTLWALLCLLAIALASLIRKVPAYPLLAVYAGGHLISLLLRDYGRFHFMGQESWIVLPISLATMASQLAALEFARNVAGSSRRRWFTAIEVIYILCYCSLFVANFGLISYAIFAVLVRFGDYLLIATTFLLIATGVRRHKRDAYILAGFGGFYLLYLALWKSLQYIDFDYPWLTRLADGFVAHLQPSPMYDLIIVAGFLTVVIMRTLHLVRERATIATEIEAARTMQQLLLARSTDPTPGFLVETAYLPAGEVGGDFFLVSTLHETEDSEAGLFCIVGDVSGKGMRAAMRVSMILGVLRREPSRDPATVLYSLNEALLSDHSDSGFTTACCVRIHASGEFTVANAGHIAPYLASAGAIDSIRTAETGVSHELETPPALPLGLAPGQTYDTVSGSLLPGQRLVLMSDGVPEARSHKGELYGFDRLPQLTLHPAAEIARTAQSFGQDDDITVLTIAALTPTTNQPPPPTAAPQPAPPPPVPSSSSHGPMRLSRILHALVIVLACARLAAQAPPAQALPVPVVDATHLNNGADLHTAWLYRLGDDPAYASPTFDDRSWLRADRGYAVLHSSDPPAQYLWFRIHIHVNPNSPPLAYSAVYVTGPCQFFLNGQLVDHLGPMGDGHELYRGNTKIIPIPATLLAHSNGDLVLAIRFFYTTAHKRRVKAMETLGHFGFLSPGFRGLLSTADSAHAAASTDFFQRDLVTAFAYFLQLIVGLAALALFYGMRAQREYLALALAQLLAALYGIADLISFLINTARGTPARAVLEILLGVSFAAFADFVRLLMRRERTAIFTAIQIFMLLVSFIEMAQHFSLDYRWTYYFSPLRELVLALLILVLIAAGYRRANRDVRLLLFPLIFWGGYHLLDGASYIIDVARVDLHRPILRAFSNLMSSLYLAGCRISLDDLADILLSLSLLLLILIRTTRLTRERTQLAAELEAAETIQTLLLARSTRATPGFVVETAYHPAAQVGGDFFLVSPSDSDGSILAIVGDVSGKGMQAAMRVSAILGVLTRENSRNPAEVLANLNEALLAQAASGFTTACCTLLQRDGRYEIGNAGHINPYLEGIELISPPALPLGLAPDQTYELTAGQLGSGDRLVLLSDGVPEARNPKGLLYGFDALPSLTLKTAAAIANTAQLFGQEDDITVVALALA